MVDHSILKVEVDIYRFIYMPVVARTWLEIGLIKKRVCNIFWNTMFSVGPRKCAHDPKLYNTYLLNFIYIIKNLKIE